VDNNTPVRLALIGLGMATRPHLEALRDPSCLAELAGVCNRTRAKAEASAAQEGCRVFDSLEQIASDPGVHAVLVTTPPDQRLEIVEMMAQAGKHILMEKPIERTLSAAENIVAICERHQVQLGIVLQHRFRAGARRLKALVQAGDLGDIALVRVEVPWWRDQAYYDQPGRGTYARDGGGVLISQAIHVLDLMLSLTGPAETVQAFSATTALHRLEAEDFATAGVRFASGAVGSIVATTATYPGGTESIVLDGTLATATLCGGRLDEPATTGGGADPMAFPCDWHKALIADFAMAIREQRAPLVTGREALKVHALIDAMTRSATAGAAVEVAPIATR